MSNTLKNEIKKIAERMYVVKMYVVKYIDSCGKKIFEYELKEDEWEFVKKRKPPKGIRRIAKPVLLL
jgi:hypothetical protein